MTFQAPVRDLLFCLTEVVGLKDVSRLDVFSHLDDETLNAVLEGAGSVANDVLAPVPLVINTMRSASDGLSTSISLSRAEA